MKISDSQVWKFNDIVMGRGVSSYESLFSKHYSSNDRDTVRLHLGLRGDYSFSCPQLSGKWDLIGGHYNLMYSEGMDLEIVNKSLEIETFGVEFPRQLFTDLAVDKDEVLSSFCANVLMGKNSIFSENWGAINISIQTVLDSIIKNPYTGTLQNIFLFGKTLELLVMCLAEYQNKMVRPYLYLKNNQDKEAIIAARDFINARVSNPPGLSEIARKVGLNEFKLKYGFKEMFGLPIFTYLIEKRLHLATLMLRDTGKSISEISSELGYSSPQHFSAQYKLKKGIAPSKIRSANT